MTLLTRQGTYFQIHFGQKVVIFTLDLKRTALWNYHLQEPRGSYSSDLCAIFQKILLFPNPFSNCHKGLPLGYNLRLKASGITLGEVHLAISNDVVSNLKKLLVLITKVSLLKSNESLKRKCFEFLLAIRFIAKLRFPPNMSISENICWGIWKS